MTGTYPHNQQHCVFGPKPLSCCSSPQNVSSEPTVNYGNRPAGSVCPWWREALLTGAESLNINEWAVKDQRMQRHWTHEHLLEAGVHVRALIQPISPSSQELHQRGERWQKGRAAAVSLFMNRLNCDRCTGWSTRGTNTSSQKTNLLPELDCGRRLEPASNRFDNAHNLGWFGFLQARLPWSLLVSMKKKRKTKRKELKHQIYNDEWILWASIKVDCESILWTDEQRKTILSSLYNTLL